MKCCTCGQYIVEIPEKDDKPYCGGITVEVYQDYYKMVNYFCKKCGSTNQKIVELITRD